MFDLDPRDHDDVATRETETSATAMTMTSRSDVGQTPLGSTIAMMSGATGMMTGVTPATTIIAIVTMCAGRTAIATLGGATSTHAMCSREAQSAARTRPRGALCISATTTSRPH
jgi:hypothetical protein